MIAWLAPVALAGLLAVAGPLLVHLLRRQRARRVVVPSLRFVRSSEQSAVRMRAPADPWLLLLRMAIVAGAALAAAHPLLLTEARTAGWSGRVARAVVVDTSPSVGTDTDAVRIAAASDGADLVGAIHTSDLGRGLERAIAWLERAPPARLEIVVVSDFQRGSISTTDVSDLPADVGVRFERVRSASLQPSPSIAVLHGDRRLETILSIGGEKTAVTYTDAHGSFEGLVIQAPAAARQRVASLLRVVGAAGALAPSAEEPIVIRFSATGQQSAEGGAPAAWTVRAAERLLRSPEVAGVDVRASPAGNTLLVDVHADPDSLDAAVAVKGALDARYDLSALAEHEPERITEATLAAWSRPAGPANVAAWRQTDESDGRWLWALALLLLSAEAIVRRTRDVAVEGEEQHAA